LTTSNTLCECKDENDDDWPYLMSNGKTGAEHRCICRAWETGATPVADDAELKCECPQYAAFEEVDSFLTQNATCVC